MDKLVYSNAIIEKEWKPLAYGGRALGGRIQVGNSQGRNILQGATEIAGTMT